MGATYNLDAPRTVNDAVLVHQGSNSLEDEVSVYVIHIQEVLEKLISVEANTEECAVAFVENMYTKGESEFVLGFRDLSDCKVFCMDEYTSNHNEIRPDFSLLNVLGNTPT